MLSDKWLLTPILLTWTIWRAPINASKWRMGFSSAFKGLIPGLVCVEFVVEKMILCQDLLGCHQSSFSQCHIVVCDYRAECVTPISCPRGLVFKSPSDRTAV